MTPAALTATGPVVSPAVACAASLAWDGDDLERLANSGGPMSRSRRERLTATVLGQDEGAVRCPRVLRDRARLRADAARWRACAIS